MAPPPARTISQANPAFVFPEMLNTEYVSDLGAEFVDYLSLAFDRHRVQPHRRLRDQAVGQSC